MALNAQDTNAEQALLGVVMTGRATAIDALLTVPLEAYWSMKHRVIAQVLLDMAARQKPIDPVTVAGELQESGDLHKIGGAPYLHTLFAALAVAGNAAHYAQRINELYGRRILAESCQRETQRLDADWASGSVTDVEAAAKRLAQSTEEARRWAIGTVQHEPMNVVELLDQEEHHDWLVPGLLERMDRLVLTGDEGLGKSELVSQFAVCLAAGMHPFTGYPMGRDNPGLRVLVVDCENSKSQSRRRYRRIVRIINQVRHGQGLAEANWKENLRIDFRPEGMDLLGSHDAAYLESITARVAPDMLVLGPLYKLHASDINDEKAARELVYTIDQVRVRHRATLLTEAHAGHSRDGGGGRLMRPRGSALFVGWPEFGFGMRRQKDDPESADLIGWRGQREERDWPGSLYRGRGLQLPWVPGREYQQDDNWAGDHAF